LKSDILAKPSRGLGLGVSYDDTMVDKQERAATADLKKGGEATMIWREQRWTRENG
jgi:hypothetical protein